MMKIGHAIVLIAFAFSTAACTHSMRIKNLDSYVKTGTATKRLAFGFKEGTNGESGGQLVKFVHQALVTHPDISQVISARHLDPQQPIDATVTIGARAQYEGSGWNYLVSFPGFIVFAHAWNGFLYSADLTTEVAVDIPGRPSPLRREIHTKYNLRHCCFGRGAATSSGWYLPGWGGTNLLVGFWMVGYDDHATDEFLPKVSAAYGEFIANSVVEMVSDEMHATLDPDDQAPVCAEYDHARHEFVAEPC